MRENGKRDSCAAKRFKSRAQINFQIKATWRDCEKAKIPRKFHSSDCSANFLRFIRKRNDLSRYIIRASDRITRK